MFCMLYMICTLRTHAAHTFSCMRSLCRSDNVCSLMFEHVTWSGDALVVTFIKMKADQVGVKQAPRRVYANPQNPAICPVLALAVYLFTMGPRADGAVNLVFANKSSAARFSKWLKAVITAPGTQQDLLDMCLII